MSVENNSYINTREKNTVSQMIRIYCRSKHRQKDRLCFNCRQLENYAHQRLEHCKFGENKPACKDCKIHCYKKEYREKIQEVMRFSGPRMFIYYPMDAIRHLWKTLFFIHIR